MRRVPDPKSAVRAAILSGAMSFEPTPLDPFTLRVTPIRRVVDGIEPPLDLRVIPFRYRINVDGAATPVKNRCKHRRR